MKDTTRYTYIVLFFAALIAGFLIINYHDPTFDKAAYIYLGLIVVAFSIFYFAPKLLKRK